MIVNPFVSGDAKRSHRRCDDLQTEVPRAAMTDDVGSHFDRSAIGFVNADFNLTALLVNIRRDGAVMSAAMSQLNDVGEDE